MEVSYNVSKASNNDSGKLLCIMFKKEYLHFRNKHPTKLVEYVPDVRLLTWRDNLVSKVNSPASQCLVIFDQKVTNELPELFRDYHINYYQEQAMNLDELINVIANADLVVCSSYITHLITIIMEIPFITYKPERQAKRLLKDIGLQGYRSIDYWIANWIKHSKLIHQYNNNCIEHIKYIFNKYSIYGPEQPL